MLIVNVSYILLGFSVKGVYGRDLNLSVISGPERENTERLGPKRLARGSILSESLLVKSTARRQCLETGKKSL
jgi:hypothetical protein